MRGRKARIITIKTVQRPGHWRKLKIKAVVIGRGFLRVPCARLVAPVTCTACIACSIQNVFMGQFHAPIERTSELKNYPTACPDYLVFFCVRCVGQGWLEWKDLMLLAWRAPWKKTALTGSRRRHVTGIENALKKILERLGDCPSHYPARPAESVSYFFICHRL
jgi:hypothetical protein